MTDKKKRILIHTDGSCINNPGPGGWAAILQWNGNEQELSGGKGDTTNNQMELTAAIKGLEAVETLQSEEALLPIHIVTDSKYVMMGITQWIAKWKLNNWRTAAKKPVANQELWQQLDAVCQKHTPSWEWVKGHAGNRLNERCDHLAGHQASLFNNKKLAGG